MKKLICEEDIRKLAASGATCCYMDPDTLITPSARDAAEKAHIAFCFDKEPVPTGDDCCEITPQLVLQVLQKLIAQGQLAPDFCEKLASCKLPYEAERDSSGLKVVKGNTIRLEKCEANCPGVQSRNIVEVAESNTTSGILELEHGTWQRQCGCEETDYVIAGTLVVTINGKRYEAQAGDCVFIPCGAAVTMGSQDASCRIFFNRCTSQTVGRP